MFGLIMLQPDFGTGIILVMAIIGILFISGLNIKFFINLFVANASCRAILQNAQSRLFLP
jgi:cell division protein FtsW